MFTETQHNVLQVARLMVYVNSAGNPIIYNAISTKFQLAFRKVLRKYCCCCKSLIGTGRGFVTGYSQTSQRGGTRMSTLNRGSSYNPVKPGSAEISDTVWHLYNLQPGNSRVGRDIRHCVTPLQPGHSKVGRDIRHCLTPLQPAIPGSAEISDTVWHRSTVGEFQFDAQCLGTNAKEVDRSTYVWHNIKIYTHINNSNDSHYLVKQVCKQWTMAWPVHRVVFLEDIHCCSLYVKVRSWVPNLYL